MNRTTKAHEEQTGERKVLYVQFTNPTGYPPLEYSARNLTQRGWRVRFYGVRWQGSGNFQFGPPLDEQVELADAPTPGIRQKLFFLRFTVRAVVRAWRWLPDWVYVSDTMASPAGCLLKALGFRVIYHEHDSPGDEAVSGIMRLIGHARRRLARKADFNILPQAGRIERFREETGTTRPVYCVWNCPMREDAMIARDRLRSADEPLGIYFHGSLNLDRCPLTLIEGCRRSGVPVKLRLVGYETTGSLGTSDKLREAAAAAGPMVDLELPGAFSRHELAAQMEGMHVGWMTYRCSPDNINRFLGFSPLLEYRTTCI